jgi:AcrR family transcriptional regulator
MQTPTEWHPHIGAGVKGTRTRTAIVQAAARAFAERGYDAVTLEQVASELGITRSAVLFHFESKQAVLFEVLSGFLDDVDRLVGDYDNVPVPLPARRRREFLTAYVEVLADHPDAIMLIVRDAVSVGQLRWPETPSPALLRIFELLQGTNPDMALRIRTSAAFGAILRTMSTPRAMLPELDPEGRKALVNSALAAYTATPKRTT